MTKPNSSAAGASLVTAWLPAFDRSRRTGKHRLAALVARLAQEGACLPAPQSETVDSAAPVAAIRAASAGAVRPCRFMQLVSIMRLQHKLLTNALSVEPSAPLGVVAISMKRLHLSSGHSPRARLLELARPMPGSPAGSTSVGLAGSTPMLICEPQTVSDEWQHAEKYWNDGLFIVDYAFVGYSIAMAPFRFLLELCRRLAATARVRESDRTRALKPVLAAAVLLAGYRSVLGPVRRRVEAYFLTSNSFATEALRTFLIELPECARIHEILHGVPTLEFENYMRELFEAAPGGGKHVFVPQLPGLDLYGVFAARPDAAPGASINAAVNRYFLDRSTKESELLEWIDCECRIIGIDPAAPAPLVVAIPGASAIEPGYLTSPAFCVEQAMISRARDVLEASGQPFVLVYTPHPAYSPSLFTSHAFFARRGVVVYADTIFTWLVADLSVGLYSSALFEAAYAGAKVFSPMREDDELYPSSLLDRLSHPVAHERWLDALSAFLRANVQCPRESLRSRAQRRIGRFVHVAQDSASVVHSNRSDTSYV